MRRTESRLGRLLARRDPQDTRLHPGLPARSANADGTTVGRANTQHTCIHRCTTATGADGT